MHAASAGSASSFRTSRALERMSPSGRVQPRIGRRRDGVQGFDGGCRRTNRVLSVSAFRGESEGGPEQPLASILRVARHPGPKSFLIG
jgi:hypothetical protein